MADIQDRYIRIVQIDGEKRGSTLIVSEDKNHLTVLGNLPHWHDFQLVDLESVSRMEEWLKAQRQRIEDATINKAKTTIKEYLGKEENSHWSLEIQHCDAWEDEDGSLMLEYDSGSYAGEVTFLGKVFVGWFTMPGYLDRHSGTWGNTEDDVYMQIAETVEYLL